jgi:hypothetical protein
MGGLVEEYRNPAYATAVGLGMEGTDRDDGGMERSSNKRAEGGSVFGRLIEWFKREFF